jgi:hypothetical protein
MAKNTARDRLIFSAARPEGRRSCRFFVQNGIRVRTAGYGSVRRRLDTVYIFSRNGTPIRWNAFLNTRTTARTSRIRAATSSGSGAWRIGLSW